MSYWTTVFTRVLRRPPSCEVIYLPRSESNILDDDIWIFFTRPESPLEWAVSLVGVLLGRNALAVSHVCVAFKDIHGEMMQIDITFDGVMAYHNENPFRDVHLGVRVPFSSEQKRRKWAHTMITVMEMDLHVQRSDWWRWLVELDVNFSCTSFVNYLLYSVNQHIDPDELLEKLIHENRRTRTILQNMSGLSDK